MKKRWLAYYILSITLFTLLLGFVPGHNGDMSFYIACAIEKEEGPADVLQKTKQVLEQELPVSEYISHAKRIDRAENNILDFYRVKPLYVWMIGLLHRLGFSYIFSTILPSLVGYFCIGLLSFFWISKFLQPVQSFVMGILVMLLNCTIVLARLSTPDSLSQMILLAVFYCLYFEKNKYLIIFLLLFSLFVRIDNFIAALIIITGFRYWPLRISDNKLSQLTYFFSVLLILGITFAINYFYEPDFWWLKKSTSQFHWLQSFKSYSSQLAGYLLEFSKSLFPVLIIFFFIIHSRKRFNMNQKTSYLLLTVSTILIARFFAFPLFEERFFTAFCVTGLLLISERINEFITTEVQG
ncbi:MAG: hypothetical protein JST75_09905 [Bacteroidetes bacterium]|nr:hypothetical protein [Bacteroidota bacterium]